MSFNSLKDRRFILRQPATTSQKPLFTSYRKMSGAKSRLAKLVAHLLPTTSSPPAADATDVPFNHNYNVHTLSPTFFLPRAATIEPDAGCIRLQSKAVY